MRWISPATRGPGSRHPGDPDGAGRSPQGAGQAGPAGHGWRPGDNGLRPLGSLCPAARRGADKAWLRTGTDAGGRGLRRLRSRDGGLRPHDGGSGLDRCRTERQQAQRRLLHRVCRSRRAPGVPHLRGHHGQRHHARPRARARLAQLAAAGPPAGAAGLPHDAGRDRLSVCRNPGARRAARALADLRAASGHRLDGRGAGREPAARHPLPLPLRTGAGGRSERGVSGGGPAEGHDEIRKAAVVW